MRSICEDIPMKPTVGTILFLISILFFASCSRSQVISPTITPLPTSTPLPTTTLVPTHTSPLLPRWVLLDQPGNRVEILGEDWNYTSDRWSETYACINYTREKEPHYFLEECFAFTQPNLTTESEREKYLSDNYEVLKPNNTFGNVGQISVMAIRLEDKSRKRVKIFEFLGIGNYLLRVEMNIATNDTSLLQNIYAEQAADILDYVLQNMLEKSRLVSSLTATP